MATSSVEKMDVDANATLSIKKEADDELRINVLASQNVFIKEELPEVAVEAQNNIVEDDNQMDTDSNAVPTSNVEIDSVRVKFVEVGSELTHLSIEGEPESPADTVTLSHQVVCEYLKTKTLEYVNDPKINPLSLLSERSQELQAQHKERNDELTKLVKFFDIILRNQIKFYRHVGVLPKIPTHSVAISVDLPILASSLPPLQNNPQESVLKKDEIKTSTAQAPATVATNASIPVTQSAPVKKEAPKPAEAGSTPAPSNSSIECIDLTDETELTDTNAADNSSVVSKFQLKHPAPLPPRPYAIINKTLPGLPPKPRLKVNAEERGIVLQWDMPLSTKMNEYAKPCAFDIFGYQELPNAAINTLLWKKIGSVKAMTLPMACTLTQFLEGNKYHFSVRAMDVYNRYGNYSDPISVVYTTKK